MSTYSPGVVSVIIPTCDRGELFYQAVYSVLKQSYKNIEVIIVDDNSTIPLNSDQFETQIPIKYHRNNENLGGAKSRNIGFDLSSGEYVCFLDDDDTYAETKIECLMKELLTDNSLDVVFGKIIKKSNPARSMNLKYLDKHGFIKSMEAIGYLHTNASLIKRDVFQQVRFDEALEKFQDTQLHIELVNKFKCKYVNTTAAFWNDNHGLNQITDMVTENQFLRSITNYKRLKENLTRRNSINLYYRIYMFLKLTYMKGQFSQRFESPEKVKLSIIEKMFVSIVGVVKKKV
jgi:glycosyltransferase involved in cell wall biosynthesis